MTIDNSQFPTPCPHTLTELFIAGTEPQRFDDWHQTVALDRRNGLRAGAGCPLDFVDFRTFTLYPAEAQAWASKRGVPRPPDIYSPLCPNPVVANDRTAHSDLSNQPTNHPTTQLTNQPSIQLIFTSPDQGSVFRLVPNIPVEKQKVRVNVRPADGVAVQRVSLLVNGQPLVEGFGTLWQMKPGIFTFEAAGLDQGGNALKSGKVMVKVVE